MIYQYIFFKYYQWTSKWFDPFIPQITTTIILSLSPLAILYSILRLAGYLNIYQFSMSSYTVTIFFVIFILLLVSNQIYFFPYYNWKEIILYFREHEISGKSKTIAYVYIIYCTSVYFILFMFLGYDL